MPYEVNINRGGGQRKINTVGLASLSNATGNDGGESKYQFYELEPAIVVSIDLENDDYFKIGTIKVRPLYSYINADESVLPTAFPLDSNIKNYPLVGEIVIVVFYGEVMYYTQRLNVFNSVNENYLKNNVQVGEDKNSSYLKSSSGNANSSKSKTKKEKPGKYFTSNLKIKPLLPFEGDIIYEGRFGQSIRFGGSLTRGLSKFSGVDESWAMGEQVGLPITIIRNGQPSDISDTIRKPIIEDINKDASSIYLTSGQKIPLTVSGTEQKSYKGNAPSEYKGKQIILNSDRIILNGKKDELFGFAKKSIGFSTQGTFNIDSAKDCVINSPKIFLGLDATEPLVLGNKTVDWLKDLLSFIGDFIKAVEDTSVLTGSGPSSTVKTNPKNVPLYIPLKPKLNKLQNTIKQLLSKQNKTL